jgi:hypothetical protein
MDCKAVLTLSSQEINRAKNRGHEVIVGSQVDVNSWYCEVISDSVVKVLKFLKTIYDLQDLSDIELEESYVVEL